MILQIKDDFDPRKIIQSGQCFRATEEKPDTYRFVTQSHVVRLTDRGENNWEADCPQKEWNEVWRPYFDLDRHYAAVRIAIDPEDQALLRMAETSAGIRILRQEPWEMLITFIISQRKNIPAIRRSVESLCRLCGERIEDDLYTFPTPQALCELSDEQLTGCSLGYRAPYVHDAAHRVAEGILDLEALKNMEDGALLSALETVRGVGIKVANCVSLFAYGRVDCAPVDVWIARIIECYYNGRNPFARYEKNGGIYQQYMFYYAQQTKLEC